MQHLESPFDDIGLPILGDFVLMLEEGKPFKDDDSGLYVHSYFATRHVPEVIGEDDNLYQLDFMVDDKNKLPQMDKRFYAYGRLQGMDARVALLVVSWSYDIVDIVDFRENEIIDNITKLAVLSLPINVKPMSDEDRSSPIPPSRKDDNERSQYNIPKAPAFQDYDEDTDGEPKEADPEDSYLNSSEDDPELPEQPDDDIPFEPEAEEQDEEDVDVSWADELEGEEGDEE